MARGFEIVRRISDDNALLRLNRFPQPKLPTRFGNSGEIGTMGRVTGECSRAQIRTETGSFQLDSRGHFKVAGNDALIETPMRRKCLEQIHRPRKGTNGRRSLLDRMAIAVS